jgi:hypothetical protein
MDENAPMWEGCRVFKRHAGVLLLLEGIYSRPLPAESSQLLLVWLFVPDDF